MKKEKEYVLVNKINGYSTQSLTENQIVAVYGKEEWERIKWSEHKSIEVMRAEGGVSG